MHAFSGSLCYVIVHVFLLLHMQCLAADDKSIDVCDKLSQAATGSTQYTYIASRQNNAVCKPAASGFSVWSRWVSKRNAILRVVFRRCSNIGRVWIMAEDGAHFLPASLDLRIQSCNDTNNTVAVPDDKHRKQKIDVHTLSNKGVKLRVLIEARDGDAVYYTSQRYQLEPKSKHRHHRPKRQAEVKPTNVSESDTFKPTFPIEECGKNRTCVRFGSRDCNHMTCDYFLSYKVSITKSETVDIELSGKTKGWIAVGFSSDAQMGGGDDVIACKRKDEGASDVEVVSLVNRVAHSAPVPKPNSMIFNEAAYQNGYIYCHVSRPLKVDENHHLDLSNDWYQLYAKGPVGSSGVLLQHDDIPATSDDKITMLIINNVLKSTGSSCHVFSTGILLLVLSLLAAS